MPKRLNRLFRSLVLDESVPLQIRLFRLMCATACVLCLGVVLPMNLLQNLPVWVNVADVFLGLAGGYCLWESRRGRHFVLSFFVLLLVLLSSIWFLNGGSEGSIIYYYFPIIIYPVTIFQGRTRIALAAAVVANAGGLMVLEHFHPSLLVPFQTRSDRMIDLVTGLFSSCLAVAALARLVMATYEQEQARLSQLAAQLAASEQNYREIFNATSDAMLIQDGGGRTIDVNASLCAMFGCNRDTALRMAGDDFSLGVSPYSRREASEIISRAMADGPQLFTWRSKRCNGELFWTEVAVRAGEIAGVKRVIFSLRDITKRIQAEEALRTQEERLRLALEASSQGWFDLNVQTGEGRASAEYARILGLEPVDFRVSVSDWLENLHPDDRDVTGRIYQECVATGEIRSMEYRRRTQAGDWKWIRSMGKIVEFDQQQRALRMLGTHTDITERKELEAQLLHSKRLESVATLAAGVAHDLNNILTPMLMASSVLGEKLREQTDREMMRSLEAGARRGAMIVRQLMVFGQSSNQNRVRVDPVELVRAAVRDARARFPSGIVVTESVPDQLWPVMADPVQLQQVMQSLCANAREAMPLGGSLTLMAENIQLTHRATTRNPWDKRGAFVVISVTDTGQGIPADIIGRIFEPFFTTKQVGEGSGLGLSTVHGIVNGHGGNVTVDSKPGRGSTFKVYLPANLAMASAATPGPAVGA